MKLLLCDEEVKPCKYAYLKIISTNLQTKSVVSFIIGKQFKKERNCHFQLSDPLPIFGMWLLALQKDSKYRSIINDA